MLGRAAASLEAAVRLRFVGAQGVQIVGPVQEALDGRAGDDGVVAVEQDGLAQLVVPGAEAAGGALVGIDRLAAAARSTTAGRSSGLSPFRPFNRGSDAQISESPEHSRNTLMRSGLWLNSCGHLRSSCSKESTPRNACPSRSSPSNSLSRFMRRRCSYMPDGYPFEEVIPQMANRTLIADMSRNRRRTVSTNAPTPLGSWRYRIPRSTSPVIRSDRPSLYPIRWLWASANGGTMNMCCRSIVLSTSRSLGRRLRDV